MTHVPRRVLLVDDDPDIRESLRLFFEEEGYLVEEAADGHAALAFLEATRAPWVVLLDRMMPRLDGPGTLRCLAERPQVRARCVIIYVTARHDPPDEETVRLLAAQTFAAATKPFDLDALLALVERARQQL